MKPTRIIALATALFAGPAIAQNEPAELLQRVTDLTAAPHPSPRDVADTLEAAKAATPGLWTHGGPLGYEQKFQNQLIASTAELMARKVSFNTALDYATQHEAWHLAFPWADRLDKRELAIDCAERWLQGDPASPVRRAALLGLRAKYGQDVRTEVEAIFRDRNELDPLTAWRLALAWQRSAQKAGGMNEAAFNAMLASAVEAAPADHKLAVEVTTLLMRAKAGQNMNAPIMSRLADLQGTLPLHQATALFDAFTPTTATNQETLAFYDALLRAVEANAQSARFIRKILDQKLKLQ